MIDQQERLINGIGEIPSNCRDWKRETVAVAVREAVQANATSLKTVHRLWLAHDGRKAGAAVLPLLTDLPFLSPCRKHLSQEAPSPAGLSRKSI